MPATVRFGDRTIGYGTHGANECPHIIYGKFIRASKNVSANSLGDARLQDITTHSCPHCPTGKAVKGSPDTFTNGLNTHRRGDRIDEFCGSGQSIRGSSNVRVNG